MWLREPEGSSLGGAARVLLAARASACALLAFSATYLQLNSSLMGAETASPAALPVEVQPADPLLHYYARLDPRDPLHPRFDWAGSSITVRFEGTEMNARFASSGDDRLQVEVDGTPGQVLTLTRKDRWYSVARGLAKGEHTVAIYKRTEPLVGFVRFSGLQMEAGAVLLPAPVKSRRIEFIGDSITAGYGNEARNEEHFSGATENNYLAWSALTARTVHADFLALAISGSRLTEEPGDDGMPTFYRRTLFSDPKFRWNFHVLPPPQAVVVNLGTNDFFQGFPTEEQWTKAYHALLDLVRGNYPDAEIWLAMGPMMEEGAKLTALRRWDQAIVLARRTKGDQRVHFLEFPPQSSEDGTGADGHPSLVTHRKMAAKMTRALQQALHW